MAAPLSKTLVIENWKITSLCYGQIGFRFSKFLMSRQKKDPTFACLVKLKFQQFQKFSST